IFFDYLFNECPHRLHGQIVKEQTDLSLPAMPLSVSVRSHYREEIGRDKLFFRNRNQATNNTPTSKYKCDI
ncbi:hypothetical protein C9I90_23085, partial [Photobacterium aphoticum]|uniref:hypothetical protein n=1 Tax=Photobacterium aphoticum TaxID=754436 RepID=UPI000D4B179E